MRARRNLIGCGIVLAATSTALRAAQNVPSGLSLPEITATLVGCEKAYAQLLLQKEDQKLCESLIAP